MCVKLIALIEKAFIKKMLQQGREKLVSILILKSEV